MPRQLRERPPLASDEWPPVRLSPAEIRELYPEDLLVRGTAWLRRVAHEAIDRVQRGFERRLEAGRAIARMEIQAHRELLDVYDRNR